MDEVLRMSMVLFIALGLAFLFTFGMCSMVYLVWNIHDWNCRYSMVEDFRDKLKRKYGKSMHEFLTKYSHSDMYYGHRTRWYWVREAKRWAKAHKPIIINGEEYI